MTPTVRTPEFIIADYLAEALEQIDNAIAIREANQVGGIKDLDLLRDEIHNLTCRPMFEGAYRRGRRAG